LLVEALTYDKLNFHTPQLEFRTSRIARSLLC